MGKLILALDQGTSSSRALLVDPAGRVVGAASVPLACSYPQLGWVEQDPMEIWTSQKQALDRVLAQAGVGLGEIAAIGITNQRETTLAWNKETGEPVGSAIVWQCRRTAAACASLKAKGLEPRFREKTGLVLDPYFSGTKMAWILEHRPLARLLAEQGKLAFGTVDSWLIWNLSGGQVHGTDLSNASRTLLFNLQECRWDEELLDLLGVPAATLPRLFPSSGLVGYTDGKWGARVPIAGVAGDQQAALFGQACFEVGEAKNTYGTGCFLLMNIGPRPVASKSGLLCTLAWAIGDQVTYALEGSVFVAGALVQWLRDNLGLFEQAGETEGMALAVKDNGGVYLVPAFVGLGAPHWDPYARGLIHGLTRESNKNHLVRAGLEAICYQVYDLIEAMERDRGVKIQSLKIDGGAAVNGFLCQFQADLLQTEVSRPTWVETTALGAAFLAGLAVGIFRDLEEIKALWQEDRSFYPQKSPEAMEALRDGWRKAVAAAKGWAEP